MDLNSSIEKHFEKIKNDFKDTKVKGSDIINITQFKQLNLFIIKNIYDEWLINYEKNKIDYFNYNSAEVVTATRNVMNILSNNILISLDSFKKLFRSSAISVVDFANDPKNFIKKEILKKDLYDIDEINKKSKYFKYYKELFDLIKAGYNNNDLSLSAHKIIKKIDDVTIEKNQNFINEICEFFDCTAEEITKSKNSNSYFYSYFSLPQKEVDNLINEASSKSSFENAANHLLNRLNQDIKDLKTDKQIKDLLYKLKIKMDLSSSQ